MGWPGLYFPCSGFSLQHVTWEGVSGGLLPHPGKILFREVKEGFNSPLALDDAGLEWEEVALAASLPSCQAAP